MAKRGRVGKKSIHYRKYRSRRARNQVRTELDKKERVRTDLAKPLQVSVNAARTRVRPESARVGRIAIYLANIVVRASDRVRTSPNESESVTTESDGPQ